MKYLSLDIETTSLDPDKGQILQIGMVVDSLSDPKPLKDLPKMNMFVHHDEIKGQAFALQMNDWILRIIAGKDELPAGAIMANMVQLSSGLYMDTETNRIIGTNNPILNFLREHFSDLDEKVTVAGKNAAGFDIPFLPTSVTSCFNHRVLDVGPLYLQKDDKVVPNLSTCLERAELPSEVLHCALEDALDVVRLVRRHFGLKID